MTDVESFERIWRASTRDGGQMFQVQERNNGAVNVADIARP